MNSFSTVLIPLLLIASQGILLSFALQLSFNTEKDVSKAIDISCVYNEDHADNWVYGCPAVPEEDLYPTHTGYWSACNEKCDLVYYGGSLPHPQKLKVAAYIVGNGSIVITGKDNYEDIDFIHDFGSLQAPAAKKWCYHEVDLTQVTGADATVVNFAIDSVSDGFAIIDKIIVDFGDNALEPLPLDTNKDQVPVHWPVNDCSYLDDYRDFWAFGCPVEPSEPNPISGSKGFWSPCQTTSCKIHYASASTLIASTLTVRAYSTGADAEIKIVIQKETGPVEIPVNGEGWIEQTIDVSTHEAKELDIVLTQSSGSTVMIDSISVLPKEVGGQLFQDDLPMCNTLGDRTGGSNSVNANNVVGLASLIASVMTVYQYY